jgi:ATP-binding cassette subfamily B protein
MPKQNIRLLLKQVEYGFRLGGRQTVKWASLGVFSGLIAFVMDLFLAICLQRFFVSTGLISDLNQTRFFGTLRSSRSEAILLLLVGALRMCFYWLNTSSNGIAQVSYEKGGREKIAVWAMWDGKSSAGNIANLYNDILMGASQSISTLQFLMGRIIMLFSSLVVLTYYSAQLTLFILVLVILVFPIQKKLDRKLTKNGIGIQSSIAKSSEILFFGLQNSSYLKIHGLLGPEINDFKILLSKFKKLSITYYSSAAIRGILPQFIALIYVVFVASRTGSNFLDSPGQLVAYLYLSIRFFQTIGDLGRVSANLRGSWPRFLKYIEWNDLNSNTIHHALQIEKKNTFNLDLADIKSLKIECKNLKFDWLDGSSPLINDTTITFGLGTWTTFFGSSGKGKSTLLKIISGLYPPKSGSISLTVNEFSYSGKEYPLKLQNLISYVGADPVIVPGTIKENLLLGVFNEITDEELGKTLNDYSCGFILDLPGQLNYLITENDTELSTGQKQRISIARAMLRNPKILILDEITSNLDKITEEEILKAVKSLAKNMVVIAAGHRESFIPYSDTTYVFTDDGKIMKN